MQLDRHHAAAAAARPGHVWRRGLLACAVVILCQRLPAQELAHRSHADVSRAVVQTTLSILDFARWPHDPQEVRLCVVGDTRYGDGLLTVQPNGPLHRRRVTVRQRAAVDVSTDCDALYIGRLPEAEARAIYRRIAGEPRITISERREACREEGMFCLEVIGPRKIGFAVNLEALSRSGVRMHPGVLRLGRRQETTP